MLHLKIRRNKLRIYETDDNEEYIKKIHVRLQRTYNKGRQTEVFI